MESKTNSQLGPGPDGEYYEYDINIIINKCREIS